MKIEQREKRARDANGKRVTTHEPPKQGERRSVERQPRDSNARLWSKFALARRPAGYASSYEEHHGEDEAKTKRFRFVTFSSSTCHVAMLVPTPLPLRPPRAEPAPIRPRSSQVPPQKVTQLIHTRLFRDFDSAIKILLYG